MLREKEKVNTKIASLHAEFFRCQARLIEAEEKLGNISVDELVASARDQEGRLALVRNQRIFVPKHVQVSWHTCRSRMVPASDFDFDLCTLWYFRKKGRVLLYIK